MQGKVILILLFLLAGPLAAHANPLISGGPGGDTPTVTLPSMPLFADAYKQVTQWQKQLHEMITDNVTALKESNSMKALWLLLAIGFLYGVFHVLLPGHGKVVVASYFLGYHARWQEGIWAGLIMAIGHTITAIGIVVLLNIGLGLGKLDTLAKARYAELIGYGLIALIGIVLVVLALRNKEAVCASCGHDHGDGGHHDHAHQSADIKGVSLFASASLVPCAGSMILLLFTMANDVLWAGVLAVISIALGMWITISAVGLISMGLRKILALDLNTPGKILARRIFRLCSALVITAVGALLFLNVWQAPF
jgi:ABC-type nickel/cobalt efflux system permease component RcnA